MQPLHSTSRLGVDVGGVLLGASTDDSERDTTFLSAPDHVAVSLPPVAGAFETVREAVRVTGGQVFVVSKCGARIEKLTRAWLEHQRFFERTGVTREQLEFVRTRPDKRVVACRLGLTHFVDDREDVLRSMVGLVPSLVWFGAGARSTGELVPGRDWVAAARLLVGRTAAEQSGITR